MEFESYLMFRGRGFCLPILDGGFVLYSFFYLFTYKKIKNHLMKQISFF